MSREQNLQNPPEEVIANSPLTDSLSPVLKMNRFQRHLHERHLSLEEQITITLEALTAQHIPSGPLKNQHYATITLIGHSVGAYILLELIARIRKSSSPLNVRGGILLFPTVTHLAQSP
jgi:surfactin synthase thioesterase subunit